MRLHVGCVALVDVPWDVQADAVAHIRSLGAAKELDGLVAEALHARTEPLGVARVVGGGAARAAVGCVDCDEVRVDGWRQVQGVVLLSDLESRCAIG